MRLFLLPTQVIEEQYQHTLALKRLPARSERSWACPGSGADVEADFQPDNVSDYFSGGDETSPGFRYTQVSLNGQFRQADNRTNAMGKIFSTTCHYRDFKVEQFMMPMYNIEKFGDCL
eukprot:TRINITY_DN5957_c0_g2_i7.p3 TRINITY_DN5957_c0_g2~~TRINITY_DN5957_c0_g2_i7.p3  ORF type:complete len:118 (-),score=1.35 TRINITY_DN5957_c0_g2_i7:218-571(-)